jgi:protoheme IX farnesyltransferase
MLANYLQLSKPRIVVMVLVTTAVGFCLASGTDRSRLLWTLLGTALAASACGSLNQLIERRQDALMRRTRSRPLPAQRLSAGQASAFGLACALAGLGLLAWKVNGLACALAAFTIASYVFAYTPLKRLTPQSTWVGAVSGAISPLIGWAAVRGTLEPEAWTLFAIQFIWQIPHFLAIFWIYREDYALAGFRVMPVVDPSGRSTACQIALHSFALLPASLAPTWCGLAGAPYAYGALVLGTVFLGLGMRASWTMTLLDTRRLFLASLVYLPVLFGMLVLGRR